MEKKYPAGLQLSPCWGVEGFLGSAALGAADWSDSSPVSPSRLLFPNQLLSKCSEKNNLLKMIKLNWIVLPKAGSRLQTQTVTLIHLVQVGRGNVLMLVRCSQSVSPCPMLLSSPLSRARLLLWVQRPKRRCCSKMHCGGSFLAKGCRKAGSATFAVEGGWCKVLLGLGITLLW